MANKQINPKLIQALTNEPLSNIPTSPTFKHLGSIYVKSIELDPSQLESHLSIANLLSEIKDYKNAIFHFHQMMFTADKYPHLNDDHLRELLSHGICNSFIAAHESKNKFEPLPSQDQLTEAGSTADLRSIHLARSMTLSSEDISTFYPLAEAFMGNR